jgi:hypothetical protein
MIRVISPTLRIVLSDRGLVAFGISIGFPLYLLQETGVTIKFDRQRITDVGGWRRKEQSERKFAFRSFAWLLKMCLERQE